MVDLKVKALINSYKESKKLEKSILTCFLTIIREDKKDRDSLLDKIGINVDYEDMLDSEGDLFTENITSICIPRGSTKLNFDLESITQFIPVKYIANPKLIKQDLDKLRKELKGAERAKTKKAGI